MKKYLLILISVFLLFPFVAYAGILDVIGSIFLDILCILTGIGCHDPCLRLGPAASRLCHLIDRIGEALYIIGWSLALVIIIIGGLVYMTSGGNEEQIKKAKKIIINGLIGAAIILCSGFILNLLIEFLQPLFI